MRESLEKGDKAAASQTYRETVSALDKAIQKGVLHENTASRYKSRLSARDALKSSFGSMLYSRVLGIVTRFGFADSS
jgi:hypothetical protein